MVIKVIIHLMSQLTMNFYKIQYLLFIVFRPKRARVNMTL